MTEPIPLGEDSPFLDAVELPERGTIQIIGTNIPNGHYTIQRNSGPGSGWTDLRGGGADVSTGGFVREDTEPPFGVLLTYRVNLTMTNAADRYIQTNLIYTPSFTVAGAAVPKTIHPGAGRTITQITDPTKGTVVGAISANPAGTTQGIPGRTIAEFDMVQLTPGTTYQITGQIMYHTESINRWVDVEDGYANWQALTDSGLSWDTVNGDTSHAVYTSLFLSISNATVDFVAPIQVFAPSPEDVDAWIPFSAQVTLPPGSTVNLRWVDMPAAVTNLATNPGYEVGGTGFASNDGTKYPLTADTTAPIAGTRSALSTRTATSPTSAIASAYIADVGTTKFQVTAGVPITIGASFKTDVTAATIILTCTFYDAGGVRVGSTVTLGTVASTVAGTVYRLAGTATPPAGATQMWGGVTVNTVNGSNAVAGSRVWMDQLLVVNAATDGSYFDGNTTDTTTALYDWTGTVNASTSIASPVGATWATIDPTWTWDMMVSSTRLRLLHGTDVREYTATWSIDKFSIMPMSEVGPNFLYWFDGDTPVPDNPPANKWLGTNFTALSTDSSIVWKDGFSHVAPSIYTGPSQITADVLTTINGPDPADTSNPVYQCNPIFLNDPLYSRLGQWFGLLAIDSINRAARRELYTVIQRSAQVAVADLRLWPTGSMRVLTVDLEQRAMANALFASGRVIQFRNPDLTIPEGNEDGPWYISLGDVSENRPFKDHRRPERIWQFEFVRVERPLGLLTTSALPVDYAASWNDVKAHGNWASIKSDYKTWLSLLQQQKVPAAVPGAPAVRTLPTALAATSWYEEELPAVVNGLARE